MLHPWQETLSNDEELWVQKYLELGDKALKVQHSALSIQPSEHLAPSN
jgi:hypothetical protein